MKISLENIKIYSYHGVLEEERKIGTLYIVNLEVTASEKASETDDLNDTVNYADLNEIIRREMKIPSNLLERVAGRILINIEQNFPQISCAKIKITKTNPPLKGEMTGASVELEKYF